MSFGPCLCGDPSCQRCYPGNDCDRMDMMVEKEEDYMMKVDGYIDKITEELAGYQEPVMNNSNYDNERMKKWHTIRGEVEDALRIAVNKTVEREVKSNREDMVDEIDDMEIGLFNPTKGGSNVLRRLHEIDKADEGEEGSVPGVQTPASPE
jgi:hypothetical protein